MLVFFCVKLLTKKIINAIIILNKVQLGDYMTKTVTSKDAILLKIREMVAKKGLNALSIRGLAKELGCSVGTIYYYYPSKDELIIEAIESVWEDIFHTSDWTKDETFSEYIKDIFEYILDGVKKYPNFFTLHSIMLQSNTKPRAKSSMYIYMTRLMQRMKEVLNADERVRDDAFTDEFTKDDFISFIMSNIMSLILDKSYKKDFFISVIEKLLY